MTALSTAATNLRHGNWLRSRRTPPAWMVLLASIPFLAALYLLLPVDGPARVVAYPAFGFIGTVAILVGIYIRRPQRLMSWRLLAAALALLSLGDITYTMLALAGDPPYPSLADVSYLSGYACLIAGFGGLVRGRIPGGDRTSIIDALILSAGAGSLFWFAIIQPSLDGVVDGLVALVSLAYPALDLILLALGLRVVLMAAAKPRFLQFLVVGISIYFLADVFYATAIIQGTYVDGHPVDAGWIIGILLVGVAALHPSVAHPISVVESSEARLSRPRFMLLAASALAAPAILLVLEVNAVSRVEFGLVIEWIVLFALVLVRLATTVDQLAVSLRERQRLQADLTHQANHDPLTQLANRLLFETRLTLAMSIAPQTTALIFLDLDDFKGINDTLGHPTGDDLLRVVAERLQLGLRDTDLAARLGGDEFAILVENCDDVSSARAVAERALATLRAPVTLGQHEFLVHASAGVAMGHAGSTAVDLMRDADIAMYRAKSYGKDQVETFVVGMRSQLTSVEHEPGATTGTSRQVAPIKARSSRRRASDLRPRLRDLPVSQPATMVLPK